MRAGCPQPHQGGVYPACTQHRSTSGVVTSPHLNATPQPMGYSACGIRPNMCAYTGEHHRLFPNPAQWRHVFGQAPQTVPATHHRECRQFATTADPEQSRGCSNGNVTVHWGDTSNTNNNARLAQTRDTTSCLRPALSPYSSTLVLQRVNLNMAAETLHAQDKPCYFPPQRHSMLESLLSDTSTDYISSIVTGLQTRNASSVSEETNPNTILNTKGSQQASRPALNYEQLRANMLSHGRTQNKYCTPAISTLQRQGSRSTSYQQHSSSLGCQPSTEEVTPMGKNKILTDGQILDLVAERLVYYRSAVGQNKTSYGQPVSEEELTLHSSEDDPTLCPRNLSESRSIIPKADNVAPPLTTFGPLVETQGNRCPVFERCFTADGEGREEDGSKERRTNALTVEKKDDRAKAIPTKHSTGTPVLHEHETVDKSASSKFHLPVKKQLDVTEDSDGILMYSNDTAEDKTCVVSNGESVKSKWFGKTVKNGLSTVPVLRYSLTALKALVASLENVETIGEMENISDKVVQQYWNGNKDNIHVFTSTEYPQIMMTVADTCANNGESPLILSAVSGMTLDELIEKHPSVVICSSSAGGYKSDGLNINKSLDEMDQEHGVSRAQQYTPRKEEDWARSLKPEAVTLETVQGVNDVSGDLQTKSSPLPPENQTFEAVMEGEGPVYSQTGLNKCEGSRGLEGVQYENITDDEIEIVTIESQSTMQLSVLKDEVSGPVYQAPVYEDLTDDEDSQNEDKSTPGNESPGQGHFLHLDEMEKEVFSDEELIGGKKQVPRCCCPQSVDGFTKELCPKCEAERDQSEALTADEDVPCEDETDDEGDEDDWMVIAVDISDLRFELMDKNQSSPKKPVPEHGETQSQGGRTLFVDPVTMTTSGSSTPPLEVESVSEPCTPQRSRQSSTCDTEDSADYSASPERNYLTVSSQCLHNRPTSLSASDSEREARDDTLSEAESEDSGCIYVQQSQKRMISTSEMEENSDESGCTRKSSESRESKIGSECIQHETKRQKTSTRKDSDISESEAACIQPKTNRQTISKRKDSDISESEAACIQPKTKRQKISKRKDSDISESEAACIQPKTKRQTISKRKDSDISESEAACIQPKTKRQTISKRKDSDISESEAACIQPKTKRQTISKRKDSDISESEVESVTNGKEQAKRTPSAVLKQRSTDRVVDIATPNLAVTRRVAQAPSDSTDHSKPSKEYMGHKQREAGAKVSTAPVKTSNIDHPPFRRTISETQPPVTKCVSFSRQHSLQECPSTSRHNSARRERLLSREGAASSRECHSNSKDGREGVSNLSNSNGSPSNSGDHPFTSRKDPSISTVMTSARQQVRSEWLGSYIPTPRDGKPRFRRVQEDLRTSPTRFNADGRRHYDAGRGVQAEPRHYNKPRRQRHNSNELGTPLMKKSVVQAKVWTTATHRTTPRQQRYCVGEGYKWAEKRTAASKSKGSSRERRAMSRSPTPIYE